MFFRSRRVRRDPYSLSIYEAEQPIRLDEARLEAWALSLGVRRDGIEPEGRPHRGMLPDVDLSRAVPVERRGVIARLLRWLLGKPPEEASSVEPAGETARRDVALGEFWRKPYVWLVESDDARLDETEQSASAVEYNGSRAA
jgi:hypothetical protein